MTDPPVGSSWIEPRMVGRWREAIGARRLRKWNPRGSARPTSSRLCSSFGSKKRPSRPRTALSRALTSSGLSGVRMVRRSPNRGQSQPESWTCGRSVADVHHSLLAEEVECRGPALAVAEAGVLHATERHLRFTAQRRYVHVEHAGLRFLRVSKCRAEIIRVDLGGHRITKKNRGREGGL